MVVRFRRPAQDGRPPLSDVVGQLISVTSDTVTVRGRDGDRTVPRSSVVLARPVGASRREILELARISRLGWRPEHADEFGGWLLHADAGWTGRANSVLPVATPSRPLGELLDAARRFYAGHGLPVQVQVPLPARGLLDAELAGRCWRLERPTVVLTRPLAPADPVGAPAVRLATEPDDDWLAAYHYRGGALPESARRLLVRHERVAFAAVRDGDRTVAIGRGAVDQGWLGVTAVEVAPEHRRQGLGSAVMAALGDWGRAHGAHAAYLQVDDGNPAALALYDRLGFTEHHRYHYRIEP
ncbi:MAG TPA: GNAT family N-acetyltransferase [Jatrophihabitans sp.]|nr:GNAT family N-acetyltransferase [Jatrophihabitans sp.]